MVLSPTFSLPNRRGGAPSGAAALIIEMKRWVTILDHILNTTIFKQKYKKNLTVHEISASTVQARPKFEAA
jgi:hypothetical protein